MSLVVDIEKRIGTFWLRAAFEMDEETVALLGASGHGKSMTLKCIAGIERPDRGRIVLDGTVLFDAEARIDLPPQARRVGLLFQSGALFPHMSVRHNVLCGLHRERDARRREEALAEALAMLQLTELADRRPHQLSGGQAQRVALARVLVGRPRLLMLDEPSSSLDAHLRAQLWMRLRELLHGHGTILVTHDRDEAYQLCGRIAAIHEGRLLGLKDARAFFDDPGTVPAAVLSGCENVAPARKTGEHEVDVPSWGVRLHTARPVRDDLVAVGVRAHHFGPGIEPNRHDVLIVSEMGRPFDRTFAFRFVGRPHESEPLWWTTPKGEGMASPSALGVAPEDVLLLYEA